MSNLIEEFKKGQRGENKGIPFGEGLELITKATNGIQRGRMYGVGSPPKVGKSTFVFSSLAFFKFFN
jgi:replicative DNA helicase